MHDPSENLPVPDSIASEGNATPEASRIRAIFTAVCEGISEGLKVSDACKAAGTSWRQVWEWKAMSIELAAMYARARVLSADTWADKGTQVVEASTVTSVQVDRLKEDHYRWRASVADRKRYGHQVDVTSDGEAIRPAVVILPPLAALPVMPEDGAVITETRTVILGASAAEKLAAALSDLRAGRHTLGPSEA